MREWLTVIIILLIITVILDGLRRMRANRRSSLKMSLSMHQGTTKDDLDVYRSELPNGGARVVDGRNQKNIDSNSKPSRHQKQQKPTTKQPYRIPQQVSLNLDEHVPMLMESVTDNVDISGTEGFEFQKKSTDPYFKNLKKKSATTSKKPKPVRDDPYMDDLGFFDEGDRVEPKISSEDYSDLDKNDLDYEDTLIEDRNDEDTEIAGEEKNEESYADESGDLESYDEKYEDNEIEDILMSEARFEEKELDEIEDYLEQHKEEPEENYSEPEDVLVINVMAVKGEVFDGQELLDVVLSKGMRFGTMNIFHHHEDTENDGCILYSMANLVKPGTFDLNSMDEFTTPGVSLFMPLPLESDSMAAFEKMVATAKAIAIQLYGDLKDENRSVLTQQTIEHYRSRIQEFERKHRLKNHV